GGSWPKGALVQLGYTRNAEPILFIAQQRARMDENDLFFSDRGVKVSNDKMAMLEPLNIFVEPDDGSSGHAANDTHLYFARSAYAVYAISCVFSLRATVCSSRSKASDLSKPQLHPAQSI